MMGLDIAAGLRSDRRRPNMQALAAPVLGVGGGGSGFGGNGGGNQHGPIKSAPWPAGWRNRMQQSMPGGLLGALFGGGQQPRRNQQPMQLPDSAASHAASDAGPDRWRPARQRLRPS